MFGRNNGITKLIGAVCISVATLTGGVMPIQAATPQERITIEHIRPLTNLQQFEKFVQLTISGKYCDELAKIGDPSSIDPQIAQLYTTLSDFLTLKCEKATIDFEKLLKEKLNTNPNTSKEMRTIIMAFTTYEIMLKRTATTGTTPVDKEFVDGYFLRLSKIFKMKKYDIINTGREIITILSKTTDKKLTSDEIKELRLLEMKIVALSQNFIDEKNARIEKTRAEEELKIENELKNPQSIDVEIGIIIRIVLAMIGLIAIGLGVYFFSRKRFQYPAEYYEV